MARELPDEVEAFIAAWRPRAPEPASVFARQTVRAISPSSVARAKSLLWACMRLGRFGLSVGLETTPAVLLHPSTIERFVLLGAHDVSPAARRTLRTNLRFVAAHHDGRPAPARLPRERAKAPYTDAEMAGYLAVADAQLSFERRMRAQGLICLGAGAGLMGADLRRVRGRDVISRSGGLIVEVRGPRARAVPVLETYQDRLVASAAHAGDTWVIGGSDPDRHNVTTPLIASLSGTGGLPRLETQRLRSTWLAAMAQRIGLATFMAAAGITCSQRLGDIIATLTPGCEADAVELLGTAR